MCPILCILLEILNTFSILVALLWEPTAFLPTVFLHLVPNNAQVALCFLEEMPKGASLLWHSVSHYEGGEDRPFFEELAPFL